MIFGIVVAVVGGAVFVFHLYGGAFGLGALLVHLVGVGAAVSGYADERLEKRRLADEALLEREGEALAAEVARRGLRGREAIAFLEDRGLTQVRSRTLVLARAKEIRDGV